MENNIDVVKQLEVKNHEIFVNKLNIDLDNHFQNLKITMQDIINKLHSELDIAIISLTNEENSEINYHFFDLINDKLVVLSNNRLSSLKNTIKEIDDIDYEECIDSETNAFVQELSTFYKENISKLIDDLGNNLDEFKKKRIIDYLNGAFFQKFIMKIKEALTFNNKVLLNNYYANCERIESINQKTLK